ncbi:Rne/Rng family ribonuclease [Alloscardovia venturai]|uniref:Rne/Rng family ribonuclease n=1 Tax=Alloscardovia venturai TaxID=1769421 RepID=A0ABW2Y8P3_9BIFI
MSENKNQEPPRLGRRTNQGSRRVVRATGAKDSQVTQISQPSLKATADPTEQSLKQDLTSQRTPHPLSLTKQKAVREVEAPQSQVSARRSSQRYKRNAQQERIADELFVDKGIEIADEVAYDAHGEKETTQVKVAKAQESRDHDRSNVVLELPEPRIRKRKQSEDSRARSEQLRTIIFENHAENSGKVDTTGRRDSDSFDNAHEENREDTVRSRSRRAHAAVSQMLEFSSSETTHEETRTPEDFAGRTHLGRPNPMMSLLFQAPVIPSRPQTQNASETEEDNEGSHDDANRRSRRNRRNHHEHADEVMDTISQALDETERKRSRDEGEDSSDMREQEATSRRTRRSRRLNAEERRAAAEVEAIEHDIDFDDISYEPIEDESKGESNDDEREARRRRNHRSSTSIMHDDDEDESFTTRRRRRRRGAKNTEDESHDSEDTASDVVVNSRSRKQQYIDEITDIEGSTRLEAKRQRRRDNRRDRNRQAALITEQDFLARREVVNRIMVVRERGTHTQVSVIEDDVLVEHYISDIAEVSAVGNIYQGRVQNVLPSMEAAFVDIGQARNGVLYAGEVNWDATRLEGQPRRMEHAFKSGDPVLVQVTKDPIGHKGARLTSQVTLAGRFLVLVPSGGMTGVSRKLPERERARLKSIVSKVAPEEMGVIIRTAAEGASEEAIIKDLEHLKHQWEHISQQLDEYKNSKKPHLLQGEPDVVIRVIRDIFNDDFKKLVVEGEDVYNRIREYIEAAAPDLLDRVEQWDPQDHQGKDVFDRWQIDSQLRKGMERQVYLPSGGSLVIDRTEAMTTIDVNTGRFIGKGKSLEETVTRCNLEAAEEVVRQLRLRDIGGMVMIDFVDMVMPANRDLVLRRLVECLSRDRTKHQVAEVTSLGLVQMTRKRVGQGLVEAFSEECPTCGGRGFILHDEPTVNSHADDPYAMKGGDPFVKTNKHGHSVYNHVNDSGDSSTVHDHEDLLSTTEEVKNSMAAIAAAGAVSSNSKDSKDNKSNEDNDSASSLDSPNALNSSKSDSPKEEVE